MSGDGIGRALITGATGFIGFELSRQLAARGLRPRLMVRRPHRAALVAGLDAEMVQADLRSSDSLRRAVQGVDTVFHLGARATFESYRRLHATHVAGSAALAEAGVTLAAPLRALQRRPTLATRGTIVGFNLELPVAPGLVWSDLGIRPSFPTIREGIPAALDDYLHFRWRHPVLDRSG